MDPDATLHRLRVLVEDFNIRHGVDHPQRELVDAVADLDEWLTKGGFLPGPWEAAVDAHAESANYCPACGQHRKENHRSDCPYVVEGRVDREGRDTRNGKRLHRWGPTVEESDYS